MVTFMPFASLMFFTCIGVMEGRTFSDIKYRWSTVRDSAFIALVFHFDLTHTTQNFPTLIKNQYMVFAPALVIRPWQSRTVLTLLYRSSTWRCSLYMLAHLS